MSLEAFVFMLLGITVELLWLWGGAHGWEDRRPGWRIVAAPLPLHWMLSAGATLAALLVVLVLRLLNLHEVVTTLADPLPFIIFTVLGAFVFFAGVIGNGLLPQINEKSLIATQLIVLFGLLWGRDITVGWLAGLTAVPAALILLLVLRRTPFGPLAKAFLYLWYLFLLILQIYLDREVMGYFSQSDLPLPSAFALGVTLVFLILHGLFAVRFTLIASSLLFPKNRAMVAELMPRLFHDEQVSPLRFFLSLAALLSTLAVVIGLDLANSGLALNAAVLVSVQLVFRSRIGADELASLR